MKASSLIRGFAVAAILFSVNGSPARADDEGGPASLEDVHKVLQQAAGDSADSAPPPDQQRALIDQALKMVHRPHVFHHELKDAARDFEAALGELGSADTTKKARTDILDADDLIRQIM